MCAGFPTRQIKESNACFGLTVLLLHRSEVASNALTNHEPAAAKDSIRGPIPGRLYNRIKRPFSLFHEAKDCMEIRLRSSSHDLSTPVR